MKLFKLHYIYIFNKPIIILSILIILLSMFLYIISAENIEVQNSLNSVFTYNELIYSYSKVIIIIITIIIVCYSFLSDNDYYRIYAYSSKNSNNKFFMSKIMVLISYIFFITLSELVIASVTSIIFFNGINVNLYELFINILVLSLFYMAVSTLFIVIFDYYYIIILVFIIYLTFDSLEINNVLTNNVFLSLFMFIVLFIYSIYIYNKKDIIA